MFDAQEKMKGLSMIEPIPTPVAAEFPHTDELPEGCHLLTGLTDDRGCLVDVHPNVIYAERDGRKLQMIIFEPVGECEVPELPETRKKTYPCVAYIQGSAFHEQWLWYHVSSHVRMAERGIAVAVIQYRPSEVAPFPAQMQDAKTAIRYLRKHAAEYRIDPDRIAVMGDSSGGHTALMAGFTGDTQPDTDLYGEYSAEVKCIIDYFGPTVFSLMNYYPSSQDHRGPDSPEGFEIGRKNVLENPELANKTIPMNYLSKDRPTPPLLIIHGGRDMLVPFNQSCQLYNCMKEMGKSVEFYKIDQANHGILGFENDTVLNLAIDFLKKYL